MKQSLRYRLPIINKPVNFKDYITSKSKNNVNSFCNSDYIMKNGILIGCHQGLNLKQIEFIHKK